MGSLSYLTSAQQRVLRYSTPPPPGGSDVFLTFLHHPHHPDISSPLSPPALQAVMGSLIKRLLAHLLGCGTDPHRLYHATIMPCYDKKLEAVREELTLPGGVPEVIDRTDARLQSVAH